MAIPLARETATAAVAPIGAQPTSRPAESAGLAGRMRTAVSAATQSLIAIPPIYSVTAAIITGDAIGVCGFAVPLMLAIAIGLGAAALFVRRATGAAIAVALIAIASAATVPAMRAVAPTYGPSSIRSFSDYARVTIEGRVDREPMLFPDREYVFLNLRLAGTGTRDGVLRHADGEIRVTYEGRTGARLGDEVRLSGTIRFPRNFGDPGEFDYSGYLARQGIAATIYLGPHRGAPPPPIDVIGYRATFPASDLAAIRARIRSFIDSNLEGDARAEMLALVIGDTGEISPALRQRFALTGMAHMLVISGLHLGFVAAAAFVAIRLLMSLFPALMARGYGNKAAALASALAVIAYAAIAGHRVSTIRALVMALSYTLAVLIDRSREVIASLALAALIICLALPGSTADIGFQLSFISVIAIVLGMRRAAAWWRVRIRARPELRGQWPRRALAAGAIGGGYVAISFWAMAGVSPLTAYHFNQFSIVGIAANAIVVPIMALGGVVCGLAAAALSFIAPALAVPLIHLAAAALRAGTSLAGWFMRWPGAWERIFTPTLPEIAIAYAFLFIWLSSPLAEAPEDAPVESPGAAGDSPHDFAAHAGDYGSRASPGRWRRRAILILLAATLIDAGYWTRARYFDRDLRVTFLSVGQGDAAVVQFPGARVMVIDGGERYPGGFDFGERIVARFLWSRKIMHVDWIALSHPDSDHFGGLGFIAQNFSPATFMTSAASSPDVTYRMLLAELDAAHVHRVIVDSAMRPFTTGGASVRVLGPTPDERASHNNLSMVMRIAHGATAILFTGDLEAAGERTLLIDPGDLRASVLKVPHHGSVTSSSPDFVAAVRPKVAVISLGYHNRFHFPAQAVVDRYEAIGADVLRTDQTGAISVESNGRRIWVNTYYGGHGLKSGIK